MRIKNYFKYLVITIIIINLSTLTYSTEGFPTFMILEGTVEIDNQPAPIDTTIKAYLEDNLIGEFTVNTIGEYGYLTLNGKSSDDNKIVNFKIDNYNIDQTIPYASNTGPTELNLTLECKDGQTKLCPLQQGVCSNSFETCIDSHWAGCNYGPNYETTETKCDNLDNDCDNIIDENILKNSENQFGLCSENTQYCNVGNWLDNPNNYIPQQETCDNKDNDCDNSIDEELNQLTSNQNGLCSENTETCSAGSWIEDAGNYIPIDEICNNKDDDCDGSIDEDGVCWICTPGTKEYLSCGSDVGECSTGTKTKTCLSNGQWSDWSACIGEIGPKNEYCDNKDNDCDGIIDQITSTYGTDTGECKSGILTCISGTWKITKYSIGATTEICDGKDNDCDGQIDEGGVCGECSPGDTQTISCGSDTGECKSGTQTRTCKSNRYWGSWSACIGEIGPSNEICDNKDNDCDFLIDESLTKPFGTTDIGVCEYGILTCSSGIWKETTPSIEPTDEILDGLDNNCDGEVDEGLDLDNDEIPNYEDNCPNDYNPDQADCNNNGVGDICDSINPNVTEICDNIDNNCNNKIDEDLTKQYGTTDIGECKYGTKICQAGRWEITTPAIEPTQEICDNKDNDCDGEVDEGEVCEPFDNIPPEITIINPKPSTTFTKFPFIGVEGTASDNRDVTKVEINYKSQGWRDVSSRKDALGIISWKVVVYLIESKNFYSLKVRAFDESGNIAQKTIPIRYLQCEKTEKTSCSDGIDNDCNGLTDCEEDICNEICAPIPYSEEAYNKCLKKVCIDEEELEDCKKECDLAANTGNLANCKDSNTSNWACYAAWE